ncbi:hypothetical protein KP806_03800 [Paenibacillus sp. N4]|uniref:hypothetical protein n=1 Tax=Paenibacillus vietnamensis TaxID=2590547 RepID=UPI001CD119F5|nr:hypothetical protein [Paenibacillus vietnamensis]MCA0754157.1 hypothetical protein [Paenibacillus vietnamensis]
MMKVMRWKLFILAITMLAANVWPGKAAACTCAEPVSVQEIKQRSHAVFEGKAVSVKESSLALFGSSSKAVSFQVNEVWKGQVAPTITVITAGASDSCGFAFEEGERYLVYASERDGNLEAGLCGGTMHQSAAGEQLAVLGNGSVPPQAAAQAPGADKGVPWPGMLAVFAAAAAASGYLVYRSRLKVKSKT